MGGFLDAYLADQTQAERPSAQAAEDLRPGEWRGVWTWMELVNEEVLPACLEILGRGREIADELGARNVAVVFGHGVESESAKLGEHGADRVFVVDRPEMAEFGLKLAREALVALIKERRPEILLFPATVQGRNLAAQVAAALGTGIVPNCRALTLDATERLLIGHQTSFGERLFSDVVCPLERPQIFTVTPGSYRRPTRDAGRRAAVFGFDPPAPRSPPRVRVLSRVPERPHTLEQYDAIVAGGLGLGSREGFSLAEELAQELIAYAGATRGGVACGWAKAERLISSTRHRLQPRLYVACGVAGEYDHLKAIEDADFVVALTEDSNAPIADNADLVGLGDPVELLRRVLDDIRRAKRDRVTIP